MFYIFLLISCLTWLCASTVTLPIVDEEVMKPQDGQICGFGDMNKDRYTDLIVRNHFEITIMLQTENGQFNPSQFKPIPMGQAGHTVCAVADFNGDAMPDIMVTYDSPDGHNSMKSIIFFNEGTSFREQILEMNFVQPPSVVDINGDGIADLVGFKPNSDNQFVCLRGDKNHSMVACEHNTFPGNETIKDPYLKFSHIFADITGDLSSEIIFALTTEANGLRFEVWQQTEDGIWNHNASLIPDIPSDGLNTENLGGGTVADFDGDGLIDILVPVCRDKECHYVEKILIFSTKSGWVYIQLDLKDSQLVVDQDLLIGGTVFRVGDFTLDGYPDLIAVASKANGLVPVIFENVEYSGNTNFSRKFEMMVSPKTPQLVIPSEMYNSVVRMATFFDLKEDGNLDILVEYKVETSVRYDFIKCDDKGDTTFLKAQIFSNVCTRHCKNSTPSEIGSGIPWHGACAAFTMPDTSGNTRRSLQCQLPQTSQRALHSPYLLFGLGRSPNFIDEVRLGSPRVHDSRGNQQSALKQIVPNSRIFVVPPEGDGIHWQSRLYITPSQLIIQSVAVLISVCIILIVLIFVLHYRERQQDRRERQAQLHRFHFDAM
uniref:T-cell immunomodulatory protein n=1 Tax=Panagrellus redivivus TaxID=6233 RepID=A0A7E5A044_PANRE